MKCWNCLQTNSVESLLCPHCGQPLQPNPAQQASGRGHLDYLLGEIDSWEFLGRAGKERLKTVYRGRKERLKETGSGANATWPDSDWQVERREVAPTPQPPAPPPPEPVKPPQPGLVESLMGEADIRWFHSLGALLVVAAVIGWLRASWDSYGRALAGGLIFSSPVALHLVSRKLKAAVPLSSRLLAILANLLTPPALLAVDIFGWLPPEVPHRHYWTFALLISSSILSWQAHLTRERVPLYVGALCAVLAGWSQGALATAFFSLTLGFLFSRDFPDDEPVWAARRQQVGLLTGTFGALATLVLFETGRHPMVPVSAFTVALLFLHMPTLQGNEYSHQGGRLFLQTAFTLVGCVLMRSVLGISSGGVALYLLFAIILVLAGDPESPSAWLSLRVAWLLGAIGLGVAFLGGWDSVASAHQTPPEVATRFLFAALGTAYFTFVSRKRGESQSLFLPGLLCLLGGWVHLFLYALSPVPLTKLEQLIPLTAGLALFTAFCLVASRKARLKERATIWLFCFPVALSGLSIALLGTFTSADSRWDMAVALFAVLTTAWERGWLAPKRVKGVAALPRLTVVALTSTVWNLLSLPTDPALFSLTWLLLVGAFALPAGYGQACWEMGWLLTWSALFMNHPHWLMGTALMSFAFALSDADRKRAGLLSSTILSAIVVLTCAPDLSFSLLYLPALFFAAASLLSPKGGEVAGSPGEVKRGFDVLLALAVLVGRTSSGGSSESLLLILGLACLACLMQRFQARLPKLLSPESPLILFVATLLWSLRQGPFETGLLFVLAGLGFAFTGSHKYKSEIVNVFLLLGAAQLPTEHHFLLEGGIVCLGILLSELGTALFKRASTRISNVSLLILVALQHHSLLDAQFLDLALLFAALLLALRALHQTFIYTASLSGLIFLIEFKILFVPHTTDIKLRLLPAAISLVLVSLWKWRANVSWPGPVLRVGLALLVVPAFLQFAAGRQLWENFVWMLLAGSLFLGSSFPTSGQLSATLRQAGGYTLTGWAAVSLTRAALKLPWQAATLVIGLVLVAVGIAVERRNRKGS